MYVSITANSNPKKSVGKTSEVTVWGFNISCTVRSIYNPEIKGFQEIKYLKITGQNSNLSPAGVEIYRDMTIELSTFDLKHIFAKAIAEGALHLPELDKILSLIEELKAVAASLTEQVEKTEKKTKIAKKKSNQGNAGKNQ